MKINILQKKLAFDLLIRIVVRADLNEIQMVTLAVNLWKLSKKNKIMDSMIEVNEKSSILNLSFDKFFFPGKYGIVHYTFL